MTKIDIISGFLGAGKTTLIKKLLAEAFPGEKLVLIENEFGEISIDGGFLKDSGIQISEMSSGCICCSLVGDFGQALKDVQAQFAPDRILIEPSGVGKLSDVIAAVRNVAEEDGNMTLNSFVTVADASKVKVYMKNFGEFYNNQVENAGTVILSRTQKLSAEKLDAAVKALREKNPDAAILTTPWDQLDGAAILSAIQHTSLEDELMEHIREEQHHHHHEHDEHCCCGHDHGHEHEHHHHHEHDEHCCCGHDHDHEHEHHHHEHDEHCCCGHDHDHEHEHHHHHEHDEHCCCGHDHDHEHEHHHHHEHDEHCCCGHDHDHEHEHHHHEHDEHCCCGHDHHDHHADEIFASWGAETPKVFPEAEIRRILTALDSGEYGSILRAKGIVPSENGTWLHFDYVPGEHEIRAGSADYTGRLCVIGAQLKESALPGLFGL